MKTATATVTIKHMLDTRRQVDAATKSWRYALETLDVRLDIVPREMSRDERVNFLRTPTRPLPSQPR